MTPMTYADFTLETAVAAFGLTATYRPLFPALAPVEPPAWLTATLARAKVKGYTRRNEKARSEFFIAPVLSAVDELSGDSLSIYSGQAMSVDPARGLAGECDFILGGDPAAVFLQAPLLTVVEAKRADIDLGTGQAVAQSVAARLFNESAGQPSTTMHGCVATGTEWQFLRLDREVVTFDPVRYSIS